MILDYNSFKDDFLFESIINETYLYYVKDFKDVLYKLSSKGNQIAKELIDIEYKDNKSDNTFISLGKDGYVSYNRLRDLKRNIEKSFIEYAKSQNLTDDQINTVLDTLLGEIENGKTSQSDVNYLFQKHELGKKSRNEVKLGRFINAVLPGKFNPNEIEQFTNQFKATLEKQGEHFEEVSGTDIEHWYNYENYVSMEGSLGNSCMARKKGIFNIYVNNPEVCKMLVLIEDEKLIGRALVWKLNSISGYGVKTEGDVWFMDRQYTINDSYVEKFRNYAKEKGWYYKSYNNHHSYTTVTVNGEEKNCDMTIQVKAGKYSGYPYMDTFKRYNPEDGMLYNDDESNSDYEGQYILSDTGGGYEEIEGGIWSEWHDRMIPEDEAVWSDYADSYIYRDRSTYVSVGSRRNRNSYYPEDCEDIVYDEWIDEPIHIDDAVYSEPYQYYLLDENAVRTIDEIYSDGDVNPDENWRHMDDSDIIKISEFDDMLWYIKLSDEFRDWTYYDHTHIIKDNLTKNYKGEWIPKILKTKIYKVSEADENDSVPTDLGGIEWLTKTDALILGWKVDTSEDRVIDKIQYNVDIESLIPILIRKIGQKLRLWTDKVEGKGQQRLQFEEPESIKNDEELRNKKILGDLRDRKDELDSREWIYED
jgi:hypothetical protein